MESKEEGNNRESLLFSSNLYSFPSAPFLSLFRSVIIPSLD